MIATRKLTIDAVKAKLNGLHTLAGHAERTVGDASAFADHALNLLSEVEAIAAHLRTLTAAPAAQQADAVPAVVNPDPVAPARKSRK